MKRAIIFLSFSFLTAASVFAADAGAEEPDTIFQKLADAINEKYEVEVTPMKKITIFQKSSDFIDSISRSDAGSSR